MGSMLTGLPFGRTTDGEPVEVFELRNDGGMRARLITYGGILLSLEVPDRDGRIADVVLGFDTIEGYLGTHPYFGAIIGRFANRIAGGRFLLDGILYELPINDGVNHLHGGTRGFDRVVWEVVPERSEPGRSLALKYLSPDGEEGYPGEVECTAIYSLTEDNDLRVQFEAASDRPTVVNLTHHAYFNLLGEGAPSVLDHVAMIAADRVVENGPGLIPTGRIIGVDGTPLDLRNPVVLRARVDDRHPQLLIGGGFDSTWVINRRTEGLEFAGRVHEPISGRTVDVSTTEPGLHLYTGNYLDGTIVGKRGHRYERRSALCLETQHFADSPNHPSFPSTVLSEGEEFRSLTVYRFTAA